MAWYNSSWDYRVKITIDNTKVDSTLTNFPVYVDLSDLPSGFHTNVKSDGGDIRVTSSDGSTWCAREVVYYDSTNDEGELHFKANSAIVLAVMPDKTQSDVLVKLEANDTLSLTVL